MFPGTLAALGVVSAVHYARRTGEGQFLDVSMYDAILALCENMVYHYRLGGSPFSTTSPVGRSVAGSPS